jgi:hypothetical protein
VSMANGAAEQNGPPWVHLLRGRHGQGRTPSNAPRHESSEVEDRNPPWLQYGAARER